jgi:hypothetical protein
LAFQAASLKTFFADTASSIGIQRSNREAPAENSQREKLRYPLPKVHKNPFLHRDDVFWVRFEAKVNLGVDGAPAPPVNPITPSAPTKRLLGASPRCGVTRN